MVCHERDVGGKHRGEAGVVALHLKPDKTTNLKTVRHKNFLKKFCFKAAEKINTEL
jgi:hypothetical protein